MARKEKFSKEAILKKSVNYVHDYGIERISTRELSKYIGCSTQPLFRCYQNMEDFYENLLAALYQVFISFTQKLSNQKQDLFAHSYSYILFARKEPNIFKALFMNDKASYLSNLMDLDGISTRYQISKEKAMEVRDICFYVHGIACQIAINQVDITDNDLYKKLKQKISEKEKY